MDSDSERSYGSSSHSDSSHNYYQITSEKFQAKLPRIRENNPHVTRLDGNGEFESVQNMTDEDWEQLGKDIANNKHLEKVNLSQDALDDQKASFLFRGLTRSSSITDMDLQFNNFEHSSGAVYGAIFTECKQSGEIGSQWQCFSIRRIQHAASGVE